MEKGAEYDFVIVGSGFGGSVAALRLVQKGYRVALLEQGRRVTPADMQEADRHPHKFLWEPALRLKGYFSQVHFQHASVFRGVGVGGGSLVYAAVLLRPKAAFYQAEDWRHLADWQRELAAHYDTASHMLGVTPNPCHFAMDQQLKQTAEVMGKGETFGTVQQGIFFGQSEQPGEARFHEDPFFNGAGPHRVSCNFCGKCVTGCAVGAKNSLDKNYLYLAEKRGLTIFPEHKVTRIEPLRRGYLVRAETTSKQGHRRWFKANKIVLAAGVLGTLELLFRCRDEWGTLPDVSPMLGARVRTNSEALVASMAKAKGVDLTRGTTISSDFYPDESTHITQNRLAPAHNLMRFYFGPMVDDANPGRRARRTLGAIIKAPWQSTRAWRDRNWHKKTTLLTVMQSANNEMAMTWQRARFWPVKSKLRTLPGRGKMAPTYLPVANAAARAFAAESQGEAQSILMESVLNRSLTAHILGGCPMGSHALDGVVDVQHRLFGYPDILVTDASAIPVNIGVNPSLTITAMAERAMSFVPPHPRVD